MQLTDCIRIIQRVMIGAARGVANIYFALATELLRLLLAD